MSWWEKPPLLKIKRRMNAKRFRENVRVLHSKLIHNNKALKQRVSMRGIPVDKYKEFDMETLRLLDMEDCDIKQPKSAVKQEACQTIPHEPSSPENLSVANKYDLTELFIGALNKTFHRRDAMRSREKRKMELKFLSEENARLAFLLT